MIVLIDIGNTRAKYCLTNGKKREKAQSILTAELTPSFLSENFKGVTEFLVASVGHEKVTADINEWCQIHHIIYKRILSEEVKNGVISGYTTPNQLGVDRWLALVGTFELFPNLNVLVIDAGTATTVDLLLASGQHQGGWILAGIKTLIASVLAQTAQVKAECFSAESIAFGLNTTDNVNNAAWAATVGMINLAITQIEVQGFFLDKIIITGGNGHLLSSLISHQNTVIDDLVFTGLEAYI